MQVTLSSPDGKAPSLEAIEEDGDGVSSATPDSGANGRPEGKRGRDPDEGAVRRRLRTRAASGHQVLMYVFRGAVQVSGACVSAERRPTLDAASLICWIVCICLIRRLSI